jgi:CBS domain-containing protein
MNIQTPVSEIMTRRLITANVDDRVVKVKTLFEENKIHHIPVVDAADQLLGIISKEDFLKLSYHVSLDTGGKSFSKKWYDNTKAGEIMTKYPVSLDPEDTVGLAADIFMANKFHALPVVENDQLVGIITTHDVLLFAFQNAGMTETESF